MRCSARAQAADHLRRQQGGSAWPERACAGLAEAAELGGVDEVFPISARTGEGVDALVERLAELMPEGPYLYPPEDHSDQSSELLLAELIREQVLNRTRDEIPHSVEVKVKEVSAREDGLVTVKPRSGPRPSPRSAS